MVLRKCPLPANLVVSASSVARKGESGHRGGSWSGDPVVGSARDNEDRGFS